MRSDKWIDLCFLAEAEKQGYVDAQMITLKAYYYDLVMQEAFDNLLNLMEISDENFKTSLDKKAKSMMDMGKIKVKEFIEVKKDSIMVCLNNDNLDHNFVCEVMDRLSKVEEIKPNTRYEFGPDYSFMANEIPIMNKH